MIAQLRIENYKALRDVTVELTPVHVLIGPNDSGKTSILEAMAALCRSVDHPVKDAFVGAWEGLDLVWRKDPDLEVCFQAGFDGSLSDYQYRICSRFEPSAWKSAKDEVIQGSQVIRLPSRSSGSSGLAEFRSREATSASFDLPAVRAQLVDALRGVQYYRWDPRLLALPVAPDVTRRYRMESSGFGLASCLDDILGYDRSLFDALERAFVEIFPQIRSIRLKPEKAFRAPANHRLGIPRLEQADGKGIHFQFDDGSQDISAAQCSDGVLLVLAYLTILHLPEPPRVVLVEEPENGIHPNRLKQVLGIVKKLVEDVRRDQTQVLLTTHSPYVLDSFKPEEVTLCSRKQDGSVTTCRLSESRTVQEQLDVFTLGEIWTAEGDEAIAVSKSSDERPGP